MPSLPNPIAPPARSDRRAASTPPLPLREAAPPQVRSAKPHPTHDGSVAPTPPSDVTVRKDHPVRTELPPLPTDPGQVQIEQEGVRRRVRVMTTGVFDLIHLGHIHMLEAAKRLGEELVVVVARDETVRKMKHEPLNPEEVRRQIVANLRTVDHAVLGHVGDIYQTVVDVRPDVIALGYDQKFTEEEVRRKSLEHGVPVRVVRLPQFDHDLDATRKIIERIADRLGRKELYTTGE